MKSLVKIKNKVYKTALRSAIIYRAKTWPVKVEHTVGKHAMTKFIREAEIMAIMT